MISIPPLLFPSFVFISEIRERTLDRAEMPGKLKALGPATAVSMEIEKTATSADEVSSEK